jgi:hypothetical protein
MNAQLATDLQPSADATTFSFGGIEFTIYAADGTSWELTDEHREFCFPCRRPALAHVAVSLTEVEEVGSPIRHDREVKWSWHQGAARGHTKHVLAEVRRLAANRYAASALVTPGPAGAASLLTLLSTAITWDRGGITLHSTGVELDGEAVLFVGPSGAGKTTSANHCPDGRWMARDRATIFPLRGEWYGSGSPGGGPDVIRLPRCGEVARPLHSVLRVQQRRSGPSRVRWAQGVEALRILRESAMTPRGITESAVLDRLSELTGLLRVGVIEVALGDDLGAALRSASNPPMEGR